MPLFKCACMRIDIHTQRVWGDHVREKISLSLMTHEYETVQSQKMQNKIDDVKKD